MHVLALVNQKGGCGKTTTALNLAGALAARRFRVLLIDLDPQAHATLGLGAAIDEGEPSIADVLVRDVPILDAVQAVAGGIHLLPADLSLAEFEEQSARTLKPESVLAARLAGVEDAYDFVLLDCPPRVDGVLTANAVRAAGTVLLVVETGTFALQGAFRALEILEDVAVDADAEFELRVVGTLFDRRQRLDRELLTGTQARFGSQLFDTVIHSSVRLREAAAAGVPVHVLDGKSRAASDFDALADEVLELTGLPARLLPARPVADQRSLFAPSKLLSTRAEPWMG